jgi:hypothetical protein
MERTHLSRFPDKLSVKNSRTLSRVSETGAAMTTIGGSGLAANCGMKMAMPATMAKSYLVLF